uniref:Uncharacterized protein n=1 Tax=Parascaris equorum TaxID=6256 RepID=A0A914RR94_PAREQ
MRVISTIKQMRSNLALHYRSLSLVMRSAITA